MIEKPIFATALAAAAMALSLEPVMAQGPGERGRALVGELCAGCHAIGKTGDSPRAAAPPFRIMGRSLDFDRLERRLRFGLSSNHPDMPEFKFSEDDAHAVAVYLRGIQE